jgi:hypothetical protein
LLFTTAFLVHRRPSNTTTYRARTLPSPSRHRCPAVLSLLTVCLHAPLPIPAHFPLSRHATAAAADGDILSTPSFAVTT